MDEREIDEALEPLRRLLQGRETVSFDREFEFTSRQNHKTEVKIMANIDFENIKHKITEAAGTVVEKTAAFAKDVAGRSTDAAKAVAGKAQSAAKKAKLNAEIAAERETMKKKYIELGKLYYEKYSADPDPDLSEPVTALNEALERVAEKQAQIDALEAEPEVPEEEPDHVTDEVEDTPEAAADIAAEAAEETAEEAQKTYEDMVDTVNRPGE